MSILKAGSNVRVGFVVGPERLGVILGFPSIFDALEGCLYDTGQFSALDFYLNADGKPNTFTRDYVRVQATTAADFNNTEDFGGLVAQQIQLCAPEMRVIQRDPVIVDYVPPDAVNQPGVQQVNATDSGPREKQKENCDDLDFTDYIACQLGIGQKFGTGILLGGLLAGGILLVIALRK